MSTVTEIFYEFRTVTSYFIPLDPPAVWQCGPPSLFQATAYWPEEKQYDSYYKLKGTVSQD